MAVLRIVADLAGDPGLAKAFYGDILGLSLRMDGGFIQTWGREAEQGIQVSFMTEGGSGTPVPALSVEVDNVDEVLGAMVAAGFDVTYGIVEEPWGVRRFFVTDPYGRSINVLQHAEGGG